VSRLFRQLSLARFVHCRVAVQPNSLRSRGNPTPLPSPFLTLADCERADAALLLQGHLVGHLFTALLVILSPPHFQERFPLRIPQMGDAASRIGTVSRIYTFLGVLLAAGPG
jgi:hypothetical protein